MDLIDAIRAAGVVGSGGAGFPTHVKLDVAASCLIINAAECEPLLETDKYLCRTFPNRIVRTAVAVGHQLRAVRVVIALKASYRAEIAALRAAIDAQRAQVELFQLDSFYPAGDEQTLVRLVIGRSVPERGLPLAVGCVVDNVGTILSIADALEERPVTEKYLSVTGAVQTPCILHVPIGTSLRECIRAAIPASDRYGVVLGGPMMGKPLLDTAAIDAAVVTKTTGNLLVLPEDHPLLIKSQLSMQAIRQQAKSACIQCRMCTDLCPRYLLGHQIRPHLVMRNLWREALISGEDEFLTAFGDAANCCDCGVCEMFACPMNLSPRKANQYMKQELARRGLQPLRRPEPSARACAADRQVPTGRLIARLGLSPYRRALLPLCRKLTPEEVFIPLRQHIGKPAVPIRSVGERLACGDLLAQAAPNALSANIHASMDGVVTEIRPDGIRLRRKETCTE